MNPGWRVHHAARPRLLLDVDGVLGDFHKAARDMISRLSGREIPMEDFVTWDVTDALSDPDMKKACQDGLSEPGFASSLEPFQEAQEAVRWIRATSDVEILFVTTPLHSSRTWMHERSEWLAKHFDAQKDEIVHCYRKYAVVGDALVDDKPSNVERWKLHHPDGHGILWDAPYNRRDAGSFRRITEWEEVLELFGLRRDAP